MFARFGKSVGGEAGEAAVNGEKTLDGGKSLDKLSNMHLDPANAGNGVKAKSSEAKVYPLLDSSDSSLKTKLPTSANAVNKAERASIIKATITGTVKEPFYKAADYFAKFSPNLYRRLRLVILNVKPRELPNIVAFQAQFEAATPIRRFRMVIDTFHSLTSEKVAHSSEELVKWSDSIGKVMNLENRGIIQSAMVETQLQKELGNLLLQAAGRDAKSPLRQSARKFKELEISLFKRTEENPQALAADTSYNKVTGGAELMNLEKLAQPTKETVDKIPEDLAKDKFIEPLLSEILATQRTKGYSEKKALAPLNTLIAMMKDDALKFDEGAKPASNMHSLEQRTNAALGIVQVYRSRQIIKEEEDARVTEDLIIKRIEKVFSKEENSDSFLYPNFKKVYDVIASYKPQPVPSP
ncbi:hypothetical protein O181_049471 [Austropuccinia psidii MF-1]|uniref:Uncharacterized protein n=1 Tax=Austropuccinia psidii MF-1 TaxID=1389203 RepID=A0A9Q3HLE2_9BASI|nr:hypothetical protein [Austropuccinia psidii MF-1]